MQIHMSRSKMKNAKLQILLNRANMAASRHKEIMSHIDNELIERYGSTFSEIGGDEIGDTINDPAKIMKVHALEEAM